MDGSRFRATLSTNFGFRAGTSPPMRLAYSLTFEGKGSLFLTVVPKKVCMSFKFRHAVRASPTDGITPHPYGGPMGGLTLSHASG